MARIHSPDERAKYHAVFGAALVAQWMQHVRDGCELHDDVIERFSDEAKALADWTIEIEYTKVAREERKKFIGTTVD